MAGASHQHNLMHAAVHAALPAWRQALALHITPSGRQEFKVASAALAGLFAAFILGPVAQHK